MLGFIRYGAIFFQYSMAAVPAFSILSGGGVVIA
jgi:hypothetical protein